MAYSVALGTMVTRCKQRANRVGDDQVEAAEFRELISESFGELHGAVSEIGARYFETEATITATGATSYSLPTNHLSTIAVDRVLDAAGRRQALFELMVQEAPLYAGVAADANLFAFSGTTIRLFPSPTSGTYKHLYVPQPTDYSDEADDTEIDFLNIHGYRYVLWSVASIAMHRGESDQARAVGERDRAMEKVLELALARALTMPKRRVISDVDVTRPDWWNPCWWGRL